MPGKFLEIAVTDAVRKTQERYFGRARPVAEASARDVLTQEEIRFIQARDSFYMATVSETGWPYVQHRGGEPGFLHVIEPGLLGFADYRGNRQLLTAGNLVSNDRVALFLMDYPQRERLKILGRARVVDGREDPGLVARLASPESRSLVERVFLIEVAAFDWNCSQHITPRFSEAEIEQMVAPLHERIAELEARLDRGR